MNKIIAIISMLLFATALSAGVPVGQQPGDHLSITEVIVDIDNDTITIRGEQFDFGPGPLMVTLGGVDITSYCVLDLGSTPHEIECDLSANSGLPPDGDYLTVVANGAGQSQGDEYDLTIARTNGFDICSSVYTVRVNKGKANTGEAVANNKSVDARCTAGDTLVSCGILLGGTDGGGASGHVAATTQQLADNLSILENRPLGGATACRARAHETPVNGIGNRTGWFVESWAVCCRAAAPD